MSNANMFQKLDQIEARYEELTTELSSQEVHADSGRYQKVAKMHADLSQMVEIPRMEGNREGARGRETDDRRSGRRGNEADGP